MTETERHRAVFSETQRVSNDARQVDHDRTLAAVHRLEAALDSAAPGREDAWLGGVLAALNDLENAIAEEDTNARRPDSLLSDIQRSQPRLRHRVRGVRLQYQHLFDTVASLGDDLVGPSHEHVDFGDVRQRLGWMINALRHQRARESDLIYEAYYDAFHHDVEEATP